MIGIDEQDLVFSAVTNNDLKELGNLYAELTENSTNFNKMRDVFPIIEQNPDYYLYKVEHNGVLVGTIMGIVCYEICADCKPFLVIEDVIVKSEYRRQHIGKFMFDQIENIAKARGCYISILVSSYRHPEAHIFYEKIGFTDHVKGFRKKL